MLVQMNLAEDLDDLITAELIEFGFKPSQRDTTLHRYCLWYEYHDRRISMVPHRIEVSKELKANPKYIEHKAVIAEITGRLRRGQDVTPYLTTGVTRLAKQGRDYLLLHWGILHLHLNLISTIDSKGFVTRSDDLLFIRVQKDTAHLIDIQPHNRPSPFEEKKLLEIADRNWPYLHMHIKGLYGERILNPDQIRAVRRANIIHPETVNGRMVMPTFGVTSAGSPGQATLSLDRNLSELRIIEAKIRGNFLNYFPMSARQWVIQVRLGGMWEKGFDVYETTTRHVHRFTLLK